MKAQIYTVDVPGEILEDLKRRLAHVRWPDRETVNDWSQGVPLSHMRMLVDYWRDEYDWARCQRAINSLDNFTIGIDGLKLHFIHQRSPYANAMPLLLTHGWPSSILEFEKVIPLLTDPVAHGGWAEDAFHVVIPSLPGYGFSERPTDTGWSIERIARAWAQLMSSLGYSRYVAQGGDWGAAVTDALASMAPPGLAGVHFSTVIVREEALKAANDDAASQAALAEIAEHQRYESAYAAQNSTKPQTIGYSLADSAVGQAAWIYEKFGRYTGHPPIPEENFSFDELLDNITLYWITNTATSAARLYWESLHSFVPQPIALPVGVTLFPDECVKPPRSWLEDRFSNIIYWETAERGGHFAAKEEPEIFADQLRRCFRVLRP